MKSLEQQLLEANRRIVELEDALNEATCEYQTPTGLCYCFQWPDEFDRPTCTTVDRCARIAKALQRVPK